MESSVVRTQESRGSGTERRGSGSAGGVGEFVSRSVGDTVPGATDGPGPAAGETRALLPTPPCPGRVCVVTRSCGGSPVNGIFRSSGLGGRLDGMEAG